MEGIAGEKENSPPNDCLRNGVLTVQLDMFRGHKETKVEKFKNTVREKVLSGQITSNLDALDFVYSEGHIGKHAADVLKKMKQNGEISFTSNSPCINYEKVHKEKQLVIFKLLKK